MREKGSRILVGGTLDYQSVDWRMEGMYFRRSDRIQEVQGGLEGGVSWSHKH